MTHCILQKYEPAPMPHRTKPTSSHNIWITCSWHLPIMAFTLHPVGPEDVSDITRIHQSAFANDHIMSHFYPNTPEQLKWDQDFQFFSTQIAKSPAYGGRLTKVVEESSGSVSPIPSSLPLLYIRISKTRLRPVENISIVVWSSLAEPLGVFGSGKQSPSQNGTTQSRLRRSSGRRRSGRQWKIGRRRW